MMNVKSYRTTKTYAYRLFTASALVFSLGVLALSATSYHYHRKAIISEVDQSLVDAAYAAKYILGTKVISGEEGNITFGQQDYSFCRNQLESYANIRGFDVLAAVSQNTGSNWNIIASADRHGIIAANDDSYGSPVDPALNTMLVTLPKPDFPANGVEYILQDYHDQLRIALLYVDSLADRGYALIVARDMDFVATQLRLRVFRELASIIFLHIIAFPLVASFSRARIKATRRMEELDHQLAEDYEKLKERETELQDAVHDLERFNTLSVGREGRIIELKAEVNTLLAQLGREKRYNVDQNT